MAVLTQRGAGAHRPGGGQVGLEWGYEADPDLKLQQQFQKDTMLPFQREMAELQQRPALWAAQNRDRVFDLLSRQLGGGYGQYSVGGQSGPSPEISVGPIWNDQQIQQQVNASRAANDQNAANQMRQNAQRTSAQGFGSRSPLLAALNQGVQNQNLQTNTANERETRMNARQQNAGHIFQTQMGREQQFANRMQEDIERRKNFTSYNNALLAAISGLA